MEKISKEQILTSLANLKTTSQPQSNDVFSPTKHYRDLKIVLDGLRDDLRRNWCVMLWQSIIRTQVEKYCTDEANLSTTKDIVEQVIARYFPINTVLNKNKGVILWGGVGSGKSTFLRSIATFNFILSCICRNEIEVIEKTKESAYFGNCAREASRFLASGSEDFAFYLLNQDFTFDEFGREPKKVFRFKNESSFLESIIASRYDLFLRRKEKGVRPLITSGTTNLNPDSWAMQYDDYAIDRLFEMCEVIEWKGNSKRF
jgi:hypothetical protein